MLYNYVIWILHFRNYIGEQFLQLKPNQTKHFNENHINYIISQN